MWCDFVVFLGFQLPGYLSIQAVMLTAWGGGKRLIWLTPAITEGSQPRNSSRNRAEIMGGGYFRLALPGLSEDLYTGMKLVPLSPRADRVALSYRTLPEEIPHTTHP